MKKLIYLIIFISLVGCVQREEPAPAAATCATVAEISECSATISPGASPVSITGTAQFFKRTTTLQTGRLILGAPIPTALPIKFAEVRVLNSAGTVVQCGTTNSSGALKALDGTSALQISNTAGTYTVQVLSRANHAMDVSATPGKPAFQFYTSIKKDTCSNDLHSISASVTSNGTTASSPTLTAYARESETSSAIQGGAFNILNDIATTYEYLATNTGTVDISCLNPKLNVYWQAGFNPAQYIYPDQDPSTVANLSFYLRGYNELYINGGKLGNVSTADTDHFDDAVVIHELGHRIEDNCGKMDSPGGSHNGLFRIDPRLAWSEGWGNYMGAHINKNKLSQINPDPNLTTVLNSLNTAGWVYYLDTQGYKDGTSGTAYELIRLDLTKAGNNPESFTSGTNTFYYDKVDPVANPGEGHFREVSVARSLFKITNTCNSGCTNHSDYYDKVWKSLDKLTGIGQSSYPFRSSVRFYNRLMANFGGSMPASIDATLNSDEAQQRSGNASYTISSNLTWPQYGAKLVAGATPCNLEIRPKNEDLTVTNVLSDQRYSNHYYHLDKASLPTNITTIYLTSTYVAGTTPLDIDLILYQDGYQFVPDSSGVKTLSSSQFIRSDRSSGINKTLTSIDTLSTSTPYLLNVRAFTTGASVLSTTRYTYTLTTNNPGEYLCPSATF